MQRFLSRDPIGFSSGDFNFYRYVGNSPVGFRDPFGLEEMSQYLRQTQKKNNDAVNRLVPLYNDKEAYKKELGNILDEYGNSLRNNTNGYTFSEREINLYQQRASASIQQQVYSKQPKAEGIGVSLDAGIGMIEGTIEGGIFMGQEIRNGKKVLICGYYIAKEGGVVLNTEHFKNIDSQLKDFQDQLQEKSIRKKIGLSGSATIIDGHTNPIDVFSGKYLNVSTYIGPFSHSTLYTDPDGDGIYDTEVADTWDVQLGAWSIGTGYKFGEGNVYGVKESTDNGKTWHKVEK